MKLFYGVRNLYGDVNDRARSFGKLLPPRWENQPNIGFFEFIEKFGHRFSLTFVYKERLYYLIYSCTNTIFGKNLVSENGSKCHWPFKLQDF